MTQELLDILKKYNWNCDLNQVSLFTDLFWYFCRSGEMPYDTAKARTGDPYIWIEEKLQSLGVQL